MSSKERIDKILANMGYGSRRDIKGIIKKKRVKVDERVVKDNGMKVDPYESKIEIDHEVVEYREYIYLMMNKPKGVISATEDSRHTTVIDLIEEKYRVFNPFPVGRLDKDTEGLLILTNDGKLAHELLAPRKHVNKTYYVEVDGLVRQQHIKDFKDGIILNDGYKTMEAELAIIQSDVLSKVELIIREGKFHQVKRMFEAIGMKVTYLKRRAMGNLDLDENLAIGDYRELKENEIGLLKEG